MQQPPRAYLFDMDGVLVDSTPVHHRAYQQLFADFGINFSLEDFRSQALGKPRAQVIREQVGDQLDDEFEVLMRRKVELVESYLQTHRLECLPGVKPLLRRLKKQSVELGVATTSRTPDLFLNAAGLTEFFDVVVDSTMVDSPKPAPDVYLEAARRLGVTPDRCLVIEDSPAGVRAGVAAKMFVVGHPFSVSEAELAEADVICESLKYLPRIVSQVQVSEQETVESS